jgi:hypothetical protein
MIQVEIYLRNKKKSPLLNCSQLKSRVNKKTLYFFVPKNLLPIKKYDIIVISLLKDRYPYLEFFPLNLRERGA